MLNSALGGEKVQNQSSLQTSNPTKEIKMKKLALLIAFGTLFISSPALANSCTVPKFLKKGVKVRILRETMTIVEIDKKSCWIKADEFWVNLNAIEYIVPLE